MTPTIIRQKEYEPLHIQDHDLNTIEIIQMGKFIIIEHSKIRELIEALMAVLGKGGEG